MQKKNLSGKLQIWQISLNSQKIFDFNIRRSLFFCDPVACEWSNGAPCCLVWELISKETFHTCWLHNDNKSYSILFTYLDENNTP